MSMFAQGPMIKMQRRPRIKLTLSSLDNNLELAGKMLLALMWGFVIFALFNLPEAIPTHFNASGQPDGYGDKMTLLALPALATILYFALTQLNKYPHIFNYLTKITEDNAEKQYTIATRMMRFLKLTILLIFSLVILFTYLTAIGMTGGLGAWFLPLVIVLLFIPTLFTVSLSFGKLNKLP
jgi:uncharacterized membrane protein